MRSQPRRLLSAAVSIVLGVAFLTLGLVVGDSLRATLQQSARASVGDAAVVVTAPDDQPGVPLAVADAVRRVPGVTSVRTEVRGVLRQDLGGRTGFFEGVSTPGLDAGTSLASGRLPQAPGEVAVNEVAARTRHLTAGDELRLLVDGRTVQAVRLVGVVNPGPGVAPVDGEPQLYAGEADLLGWLGDPGHSSVYVTGTPTPTLRDTVAASAPLMTVRSAGAEIAHRVAASTPGSRQLTALLAGFGAVALFVTALVIGNTFAILVAQRTRQLALLRCVGATRRQVFGSVLAEAVTVGVVGSAVGVGLGIGVMALLLTTGLSLGLPLTTLGVSPLTVLGPLAAGTVVTMVSALAPARAATRVAPLAALRPEPERRRRRTGRVRVVVGTLLLVVGAVLVAFAVTGQVAAGLAGGALSFTGVLVLLPVLAPAVAGLVGGVDRSPVGRLAVENARRSPQRAAATTGALLIGVTLITMLSVGAQTGQATIDAEYGRQFPADAQVVLAPDVRTAATERLAGTPGVAGSTTAASLHTLERHAGVPLNALAVGPDAVRVLRTGALLDGLADGTVLVPPGLAADGADVTFADEGRTLTLRARVVGGLGNATMTLADGLRLRPDAPVITLVRFADRADPARTTEALGERIADVAPGSELVSGAAQRAEIQSLIDTVLLVAVGLLGVAVVIAVVGVGNTLGLSVVERTQETGLLRALGLTRRQVRRLLGVEALTLAAVAVAIGVPLGIGYGVAGLGAVIGTSVPLVVDIPWWRVALVAAVTLAAGWLASVLPGARASRVSPAAALTWA